MHLPAADSQDGNVRGGDVRRPCWRASRACAVVRACMAVVLRQGFESAAFKLSHEMTQLLDPGGGRTSSTWAQFEELCVRSYLVVSPFGGGRTSATQGRWACLGCHQSVALL